MACWLQRMVIDGLARVKRAPPSRSTRARLPSSVSDRDALPILEYRRSWRTSKVWSCAARRRRRSRMIKAVCTPRSTVEVLVSEWRCRGLRQLVLLVLVIKKVFL